MIIIFKGWSLRYEIIHSNKKDLKVQTEVQLYLKSWSKTHTKKNQNNLYKF